MSNRKPKLVELRTPVPENFHRAAQMLAWSMGLEKRTVIRTALAIGLTQLGGIFETEPSSIRIKRGRPPASASDD